MRGKGISKSTSEKKIKVCKKVWFRKSIALQKYHQMSFKQFSDPKQQGSNIFSLSLPLCLFVCFWFLHSLFWDITPRCFLHSVLSNFLSNAQLHPYLQAHRCYLCSPPPTYKKALFFHHVACDMLTTSSSSSYCPVAIIRSPGRSTTT